MTFTYYINAQTYVSTIGADYLKRDVVLKDGRPIRLQVSVSVQSVCRLTIS